MLRELKGNNGKVVDATCKAEVALVVGMGVVKDYATGKVKLPSAATDAGIFLVTKEKVASGVYAGYGEMPDGDDMFMNIKANELVKLISPEKAEAYATDQFTAGAVAGNYLKVGTDGKFAKSTDASRFVYCGTVSVAGQTLHKFEVVQ